MHAPRKDDAHVMAQAVSRAVSTALDAWLDAASPATGKGGHHPTAPMCPPHLAVALSGGRDSMAVLHALAITSRRSSFRLSAVHIHHGLSVNADRWADFCAKECQTRDIPLAISRVDVKRKGGESLEAAARQARYCALLASGADAIALGHHADDQAETVLLQLLRGAGAAGLAAMPMRTLEGAPILLRPLLSVARVAIDAYVAAYSLAWIEDESNDHIRLRRNFVRNVIVPPLRQAFAGYPHTLVRAASHQAEAADLLDTLAQIDAVNIAAQHPELGFTLDRDALAALKASSPPRARNLLRWFLRQNNLPAPATARLAEMLAQCTQARSDARVQLRHAEMELGVHRGRIVVHRIAAMEPFAQPWRGESSLVLPGGVLDCRPSIGRGFAEGILFHHDVTVRSRVGGERLRLGVNRPRQAVAGLLQALGVPWWQRDAWPLVWCADVLAAVPGVGVDVAFAAAPATAGFEPHWHPR